MTFLIISMLRDVMTIPNALAFARNYQIPNTKLSPPLLLHCAACLPVPRILVVEFLHLTITICSKER